MRAFTWLAVACVLIVAPACSRQPRRPVSRMTAHATMAPVADRAHADAQRSVRQRLASLDSSVTWEPASLLIADIDCDGKPDSIFVGRSPVRVAVGLIRAADLAPDVISFGVHGGIHEDEVGSNDAQLALESLDYDPRDMIGEIDGFQRSNVCKGLNLGDGESDSMHLFWNHKSHQLDWWRL